MTAYSIPEHIEMAVDKADEVLNASLAIDSYDDLETAAFDYVNCCIIMISRVVAPVVYEHSGRRGHKNIDTVLKLLRIAIYDELLLLIRAEAETGSD